MPVTETWKYLSTMAVMKGQAPPFTTVFAGLGSSGFTVISGDEPSGEVTGTSYSRIPIAWDDFVTEMANSGELLWTVGSGWSSVGAVFISNASQGGQVIAYDTFTVIPVTAGDVLKVKTGNLILT